MLLSSQACGRHMVLVLEEVPEPRVLIGSAATEKRAGLSTVLVELRLAMPW